MVRTFALLIIPYACSILGSVAYAGDEVQVYLLCLKNARAEREKKIEQVCMEAAFSDVAKINCDEMKAAPDISSRQTVAECRKQAGLDQPASQQTSLMTGFQDPKAISSTRSISSLPVATPSGVTLPASGPIPAKRPSNTGATTPVTKQAPTKTTKATSPTTNNRTTSRSQANQAVGGANDDNSGTFPVNRNPGEPMSSAEARANADLALMDDLQSSASQCCGNPMSCATSAERAEISRLNSMNRSGPAAGQSLFDYCQQMQSVSTSSGDINSSLGAICAANQGSCSATGGSLLQTYAYLIDNCNGCANESIYVSTHSAIMARTQACDRLEARANSLSRQGLASATPSGYAANCTNMGGSGLPVSPSGSTSVPSASNSNDPYECATNPSSAACVNCNTNPESEFCRGKNPAAQAASVGFQDAPKVPGVDSFNVGDAGGVTGNYKVQGENPEGRQNSTVANNSGGGVPGQDSLNSASLDAKPPRNPAGQSGFTDILQGTRSGGGYTASNASNSGIVARLASRLGFGRGANDKDTFFSMDLKQYLPGGSRDPNGHLAGLGRFVEINGKGEDIFKIISNKMTEKCKLGVLWECRP